MSYSSQMFLLLSMEEKSPSKFVFVHLHVHVSWSGVGVSLLDEGLGIYPGVSRNDGKKCFFLFLLSGWDYIRKRGSWIFLDNSTTHDLGTCSYYWIDISFASNKTSFSLWLELLSVPPGNYSASCFSGTLRGFWTFMDWSRNNFPINISTDLFHSTLKMPFIEHKRKVIFFLCCHGLDGVIIHLLTM